MHELFNADISKLNLLQLADWINKCRNAVKPDKDNRPDQIEAFCSEWEEHSIAYKSVYESEIYQLAILANGIELDEFRIDISDNNPVFSNLMQKLSATNFDNTDDSDNYLGIYTQNRIKDIEEYSRVVFESLKAKDYRDTIKLLVQNRKRHTINKINLLKNEEVLQTKDVDSLLGNIDSRAKYTVKKEFSYNYQFSDKNNRKHRNEGFEIYYLKDVQTELDQYNIKKQQYFDYFVKKRVKEYDKKLFGNLAFYLSLDLRSAEKLYNINGYTIILSKEPSDIILTKCFRLGFPLLYATVLLERDMQVTTTLTARSFPNRKPAISIMAFEEEACGENICKSIDYQNQLRYVINRVSNFINSKNRCIEGHNEKISKYENDISIYEKEKIGLLNEVYELNSEIAFYQANLKGNKQRLNEAVGQKRIKERRIASIDKFIVIKKDSINLHDKAVNEINAQKYKSVEFLKVDMPIYDDYTLRNIEEFQKMLIALQFKYDKTTKRAN